MSTQPVTVRLYHDVGILPGISVGIDVADLDEAIRRALALLESVRFGDPRGDRWTRWEIVSYRGLFGLRQCYAHGGPGEVIARADRLPAPESPGARS